MKTKTNNKFWNAVNIDGLNAELTLYGDIYSEKPRDWWTGEVIEDQYITPEGFLEDLEKIKNAKNITVKLNSTGGDLYTGIAIHNALKALKGKINVIIEGIAASAASVIMCAGDTVSVYAGSLVMIHGVTGGPFMDYLTLDDLKKQVSAFEACENAIAEIYSQKTGMEVNKLRSMMTKETWMTGRQAVENGFADELSEDNTAAINFVNKNILMANGIKFDFTGHKVPNEIIKNAIETGGKMSEFQKFLASLVKLTNKFSASEDEDEPKDKKNEEDEDLENEEDEPKDKKNKKNKSKKNEEDEDLENEEDEEEVKDRVKAAIKAERNRCKMIDALPSSISDVLKNEAKYGKRPCTAGELAMYVLNQQDPANLNALKNLTEDTEASGSSRVKASSATPDNIKEADKKVAEAKAFAAQRKARKENRK